MSALHHGGELRELDGPTHVGLFTEPDPVMWRRHLVGEVLLDEAPPRETCGWVFVVGGDPVEWFPSREEAVAAGWAWVENQEPDGSDYDGALWARGGQ